MKWSRKVANERLVTRIVDRDLGYFGSWTYEFLPTESGTRLRITKNGEVPNVLFRFMSRFIFGHTATMESYLKALGPKVRRISHASFRLVAVDKNT